MIRNIEILESKKNEKTTKNPRHYSNTYKISTSDKAYAVLAVVGIITLSILYTSEETEKQNNYQHKAVEQARTIAKESRKKAINSTPSNKMNSSSSKASSSPKTITVSATELSAQKRKEESAQAKFDRAFTELAPNYSYIVAQDKFWDWFWKQPIEVQRIRTSGDPSQVASVIKAYEQTLAKP